MKSLLSIVLFHCCLSTGITWSQSINNDLNGRLITSSNSYAPIVIGHTADTSVYSFFTTPVIQLSDGRYIVEPNGINRKYSQRFQKLMSLDSLYIPDSTIFLGYGYDVSQALASRPGKTASMSSFEVKDMPPVGDTARFEFCFITTTSGDKQAFAPNLYFSENLEIDQDDNIREMNRFYFAGKPERITYPNGLVYAFYEVKITLEFSKYRWIHLVNSKEENTDHFTIGFIAPFFLLQLNQVPVNGEMLSDEITFGLNNLELSASQIDLLNRYAGLAQKKGFTIHLSSKIGGSIDTEKATLYSNIRTEAVRLKLIASGVSPEKVRVSPPALCDCPDESQNDVIELKITE